MSNWIRNNRGELVKREIVGWARQFATVTTTNAERAAHAVERRDGYRYVAACGEPTINGFGHTETIPPAHDRCPACIEVALDLIMGRG